jgi:hypothetical protein
VVARSLSFLLRARHWQIFVLLCGAAFVVPGLVESSLRPAGTGFPGGQPSPEQIVEAMKVSAIGGWVFAIPYLLWLWTLGEFLPAFFVFYDASLSALFLPLHFVCVGCAFYCLHFVAKHLKLAETGKAVVFSDYAREFLMFWFFPAGIWFLQPRISELHARHRGRNGLPAAV